MHVLCVMHMYLNCYIIDNNGTVGTSVIAGSDASISLLSSCVPLKREGRAGKHKIETI